MRKIILNVAVTLDNFIEGPNGEYDWCFTDQDYGMTEFLKNTDTIIFGRKSYELLESVQPGAYSDKTKYVFSTTMKQTSNPKIKIISGDAFAEIKKIKDSGGKDVWLFGGAELTGSLMNLNLVDEMILSVHPLLLGTGKTLFSGLTQKSMLSLKNSRHFNSGLVQLHYSFV